MKINYRTIAILAGIVLLAALEVGVLFWSFSQIEKTVEAHNYASMVIVISSLLTIILSLSLAYLLYRESGQRLKNAVFIETEHLIQLQEEANTELQRINVTLQEKEESTQSLFSKLEIYQIEVEDQNTELRRSQMVLEVQQVELERQNDEMRTTSEELEMSRDKYAEIVGERTKELKWANEQKLELSNSNRLLVEVSRSKSDFLANMSHELRTPLNSVIGFSEVLLDQLFGPINEQQKEYAENILYSGKHLLSMINDILDLAKVESGKMELELDTFSLWETLDASLMMFKGKAHNAKIELNLELAMQADVEIIADQRKLKQIIFNLLSNAIKFTLAGGSVNVQARMADVDSLEISVTDTGIGIKAEDISKLFKAFTQLESAYTKKHEGTGIGLVLSRQLVELHGGRIWLESEIGVGSRFSFIIPLRQ